MHEGEGAVAADERFGFGDRLRTWAAEWESTFDDADRRALRRWTNSAYHEMVQQFLAEHPPYAPDALPPDDNDRGPYAPTIRALVETLDDLVDRTRAPEALTVFRGQTRWLAALDRPPELGSEVALTGFLATSTDLALAQRFALDDESPARDPLVLQIHVPRGQPCAPIGYLAGGTLGEREILLPARTPLRIVGTSAFEHVPALLCEVI